MTPGPAGTTRIQAYWAGRPRPGVRPRSVRSYEWRRFLSHLDGQSIAEIATRAGVGQKQAVASVGAAHRQLRARPRLLVCPTCQGDGYVTEPDGAGAALIDSTGGAG
jgi:hypothetical protein